MADRLWCIYPAAEPWRYVQVTAAHWYAAQALGAARLGTAVLDGLVTVPLDAGARLAA
jgi:hypothetical protein